MNREFESVRLLEREIAPPTHGEVERQRALLAAVIDAEIESDSRRSRRLRKGAVRGLAATIVVVGMGGSAAFAWSRLTPDARHAATVQRHYEAPGGVHESPPVHVAGWRPELDAEHVVCDYRGLGLSATTIYSYASEFPLMQPLTSDRLIDECRSGTDAARGSGQRITAAAFLCAVTPPGERFAVPLVTFEPAGCHAPGLTDAPKGLLDERNRLRRAEVDIRAVPEQCPTAVEARKWVEAHIAASGEHLLLAKTDTYTGGRCYLPYVHWGRGEVEVTATVNTPAASGSGTTVPLTAAPLTAPGG